MEKSQNLHTIFSKRVISFPLSVILILSVSCNADMKIKPTDSAQNPSYSSSKLEWPQITQQAKPWTRWWWMGNIVNKNDLTTAMEAYKNAGLGGLEITPIYGVKGFEDKFIKYLSPDWMNVFQHTLREAQRLNMGIDMATGTGWPFGGPWIDSDNACKYLTYKTYNLQTGETLSELIKFMQIPLVRAVGKRLDISELIEPIAENPNLQELALDQVRFEKQLPLQALMAYSDQGQIIDLSNRVDSLGNLNWTAPDGNWKLYAVFQGWHGKMVERAAPGGEGNVIDHFSAEAVQNYLHHFDMEFKDNDIQSLRAFFNDSYEVDDARGQADWTPDLFNEFQIRRGYDLRNHFADLFNEGNTEKSRRILCDYRETISDLLLEEFTITWDNWADNKNAITRNQAHGSPANIIDLYAASDIPETEGEDLLAIKFASSAAHVSGKMLTSSETATWLDEHFLTSLETVKRRIDDYFIGGVNHIVYHGTTFSPPNETWPGWMFYASVHFGLTNTFWKDFPVLNRYIARCQSFLQNSQPDNDILIYFPFYDRISQPGKEILHHITSRTSQLSLPDFTFAAQSMIDSGYSVDYISDGQIKNLKFINGLLQSNGISYKTLVLPKCQFILLETFEKLLKLAEAGATIIVHKDIPEYVPGFYQFKSRQEKLKTLFNQLHFKNMNDMKIKRAVIGKGAVLIGADLSELLSYTKIRYEAFPDRGLRYIRKNYVDGKIYFVNNPGNTAFEDWIPINTQATSIGLYNPMYKIKGLAAQRKSEKNSNEIYLQLQPGESCILRTFNTSVEASGYPYIQTSGEAQEISGTWTIEFIDGGPVIPAQIEIKKLDSWTNFSDNNTKAFSGTAVYTISFEFNKHTNSDYLLDLGQVCESGVVTFNDNVIDTLIFPPYRCIISNKMIKENNQLKIKVANLMANRIADLDRKHVVWKKFYNINFPSKLRENMSEDRLFTAINWQPKKSGLIGPVTLIPIEYLEFK